VYRAVHADRSGRILVADHPALAFDGARTVQFEHAIPLPPDAEIFPIEREALASERSGRPRRLGAGRLTATALLPPGYLRTLIPAYVDEPGKPDLAPRPYAAVAADESGALVTAAILVEHDAEHDRARYPKAEVAAKVSDGLRAHPGDRLVRQLARCAREYGCHGAANAFYGRGECALPIAAPSKDRPPGSVAPKRDGEAQPTETAAFHPTTDEVAGLAVEHLEHGGTTVGFGRACEGEPLLSGREFEDAIAQIRLRTRAGRIHLDTNGSMPSSLRRLRSAGLDSICIRMISARLAISVLVLVLPGVFDREEELSELIPVLSELPSGSALLVRDLHADPFRALGRLQSRGFEPLGVTAALDRIKHEVPQVRVGAFVPHLAAVPHVP